MIGEEPRWVKWATLTNSGPILHNNAPDYIKKEYKEYQKELDKMKEYFK